jgi:filamentous hemagglutinin family protein
MLLINASGISSSHHPVKHFSTFSSRIKAASALSFFLLSCSGISQAVTVSPPANTLPTNGQVVAGSASISQTQTATSATMNVNQTSQRAVINWDAFNVGKNAAVNFNQPNANAVTLNRVTSATPSMIEGAVNANGQVIFVNPNGVTFGRGSEVNAAGVVATTMNIADKDFMDGRSIFNGNGVGQVINEGKIKTNVDGGYIALLAPEVQNQGYLFAQKGGTVAIGSGTQISLKIQGLSLIALSVDEGVYNGLIFNKRIIEAPGGLVVISTGAANQLLASVIKNTGRISASSAINNGGIIELVANFITQAGKLSANSQQSQGGQINLVGNEITIASNSKTTATGAAGGGQVNIGLASTQVSGGTQINIPTPDAIKANANQAAQNNQLANVVTVEQNATIDTSATKAGNGGTIAIWSQVQTTVAGILKSLGGVISGNGGFIETSSTGKVIFSQGLVVDTSAPHGNFGNWLTDPAVIVIDTAAANALANALATTNVTLNAATSACGPIASCPTSSTPVITFLADVLSSNPLTSLYLYADNGSININSTIQAGAVYAQAQGGTINVGGSGKIQGFNDLLGASPGSLSYAIELLAQAIYVSGSLVSASPLVGGAGANMRLVANTINLGSTSFLIADGSSGGLITVAANDSIYSEGSIRANGINGNGGTINLIAGNAITLATANTASQQAYLQANGSINGVTNGGNIIIATVAGDTTISQTIIAANGNAGGVGGDIAITASGTAKIGNSQIFADGGTTGGIILIGDASTIATTIDASTLIDASSSGVVGGASGYINIAGQTVNSLAILTSAGSTTISTAQIANFSAMLLADESVVAGGTTTTTTTTGTTAPAVAPVVTAPPPPPPPPVIVFAPPIAAPAPAKLEVAASLSSFVAPTPDPANPPPAPTGGEVSMPAPISAAPLAVMADGSIQLTPPAPPTAPPSAPVAVVANSSATQAPPVTAAPPPPPSNRAASNAGRDGSNNNSDGRRTGTSQDVADKKESKNGTAKSTTTASKYVSKYANGFHNGGKASAKESGNKALTVAKAAPPREGKYSHRINAMNSNPAVIASMAQNRFAGSISPFPPGVPHEISTPVALRGGDSLVQSYDDVPSIRNSGVATASRSRNADNYHESLESVNLMSTLNLFIIQ